MPSSHDAVLARIESLYHMLFAHSGYGEMSIEIRYLRKNEKEVLIRCGKQYRFVVPCDPETLTEAAEDPGSLPVERKRYHSKTGPISVPVWCGTHVSRERSCA